MSVSRVHRRRLNPSGSCRSGGWWMCVDVELASSSKTGRKRFPVIHLFGPIRFGLVRPMAVSHVRIHEHEETCRFLTPVTSSAIELSATVDDNGGGTTSDGLLRTSGPTTCSTSATGSPISVPRSWQGRRGVSGSFGDRPSPRDVREHTVARRGFARCTPQHRL